jgi:hypothetical protein
MQAACLAIIIGLASVPAAGLATPRIIQATGNGNVVVPNVRYTIIVHLNEAGLVSKCEIAESRMQLNEGTAGQMFDPCPPIGSKFNQAFLLESSSGPRTFKISGIVQDVTH